MTTSPRGNSGFSAGSGLPSGSTAGGGSGGGLVAPSTTTGGNRTIANPTRTLRFPDGRDTGRDRVEDRLDRRSDEIDDDLDLDTRDFERRSDQGRTIPRRVSEEDIRRTAEDWGDRPFEFGALRSTREERRIRRTPDIDVRRSGRTDRGSSGVNNRSTSPRRELRTPDNDNGRRDSSRRPSTIESTIQVAHSTIWTSGKSKWMVAWTRFAARDKSEWTRRFPGQRCTSPRPPKRRFHIAEANSPGISSLVGGSGELSWT